MGIIHISDIMGACGRQVGGASFILFELNRHSETESDDRV